MKEEKIVDFVSNEIVVEFLIHSDDSCSVRTVGGRKMLETRQVQVLNEVRKMIYSQLPTKKNHYPN